MKKLAVLLMFFCAAACADDGYRLSGGTVEIDSPDMARIKSGNIGANPHVKVYDHQAQEVRDVDVLSVRPGSPGRLRVEIYDPKMNTVSNTDELDVIVQ